MTAMSAPPRRRPSDVLADLQRRLDYRLNEHLCGMKPEHDDSIHGFNEAWDIASRLFAEARMPTPEPVGDCPASPRLMGPLRARAEAVALAIARLDFDDETGGFDHGEWADLPTDAQDWYLRLAIVALAAAEGWGHAAAGGPSDV